jgi:hypothetical protein
MADGKQHYIVEIQAYTGTETEIDCFAFPSDGYLGHEREDMHVKNLFCIVQVNPEGAEIVDNGYRTKDEAKAAWPEAI